MFSKKREMPYRADMAKRPPPKRLPEGEVNPFPDIGNDQLQSLSYHISNPGPGSSYGRAINHFQENLINAGINQILLTKNLQAGQLLVNFINGCKMNGLEITNKAAITEYILLQAISLKYSEREFDQLRKTFSIDLNKKINYYVNYTHEDEPPSEFRKVREYSETLKELAIRFGASELTAMVDPSKKTSHADEDLAQQETKKVRRR
jgi:hypothetical protein